MPRQRRDGIDLSCSRARQDETTEPLGTQWSGRTATPVWPSKLTKTRRPTMQSAPLSQGHWRPHREDRRSRTESRSLLMHWRPSGGWSRRSRDPTRGMRSWLGHIAVLRVESCPITTETENSQSMRERERERERDVCSWSSSMYICSRKTGLLLYYV